MWMAYVPANSVQGKIWFYLLESALAKLSSVVHSLARTKTALDILEAVRSANGGERAQQGDHRPGGRR